MERSVQDGFRAQKYALPLFCKAIFLIFCLSPFHGVLGEEKNFAIDQIRAGMDQISTGFPKDGIQLLRKGRSSLFEARQDPFYALWIDISLEEEARGELLLAKSSSPLQKELHLQAAEKLLATLPPSLQVHLLQLDLLKEQGKIERALKMVDGWLQGDQYPLERGLLLFAKGKLLFDDEATLKNAISSFEAIHYEGEETQEVRLILAKKAHERGELTDALRLLSKIVNSTPPSPLITEALNLRGTLLEQVGRPDLKERQQTCGN